MPRAKKKVSGEIGFAASSNGRRLTLDPIKTHVLSVNLNEVESTLPCGFRTVWISGKNGEHKFDMTVGAGCGSKWLTFNYRGKQFVINGAELLKSMVKAIDDDLENT